MKRIITLAACLALLLNTVLSFAAFADDAEAKVVRVGWFDSTYNTVDEYGQRSGYAYEYQLKISAYTGWRYEYVSAGWSELLSMLVNGEIDMLSDVSYTEERKELMLFPSLPMGAEEYFIFIAADNDEISSNDYSTLNGRRVGVNKDSIQAEFLKDWAKRSGVSFELVEVTCSEAESLDMLHNGKLDAYATVDSFIDPAGAKPFCKIGSSDFYFAVTKSRPDLLRELESAMSSIQDENRYYNQQMFEKYVRHTGANSFLSVDELNWLEDHGEVVVGYIDNNLAFCASDKETGELTGLLKDYLSLASDRMKNASIGFSPKAYPTAKAAFEALKNGEIDCVFPATLSVYDGEEADIVMTPSLTDSEVYAVVRNSDQSYFNQREHIVVAVDRDNTNYEALLMRHFPEWQKVYFSDTKACLEAVSSGVADCFLISNYRYNNISRLCSQYRLNTLTTGFEIDYSIALRNGETTLYSILAKTVCQVPASSVNASLSFYSTQDAKTTVSDFIAEHTLFISVTVMIILGIILVLLFMNMHSANKAKNLIHATENDDLTGLYNRGFFFQYANRMYAEKQDAPMDAIVLNIDRFHSVNALYGREFGDLVLRTLGREIGAVAKEHGGIAGRFEADRFDIYCRHTDDYQSIFDRLQGKLNELSPGESIGLRMGVAKWQEKVDPVTLFDKARIACSMARGRYNAHLVVFDETVSEREEFEQRLLNDLPHSLEAGEFEVFYQPKFDIQSEPAKLVGAEALVRWRHSELGMISPGDFIPLLEKNGKIPMLDKYVWSEAAKQAARWRDGFGVKLPVSVNISRVDVFDSTLVDTLEAIVAENSLDHADLRLEITESAYTEDKDQVVQVVERLRSLGFEIEMDDFGTGYSSLNMLSDMPIDVLKMDMAFVTNIEHSEKDHQLVALILDTAKTLGIPVVAEGVENENQMKLLKDMGCAIAQGYLFSRPLHAGDFEEKFIKDDR